MQLPNNTAGEKTDQGNMQELVESHQLPQSNVQNNGIIQMQMQEPDFSEFMWMANEDLEDFDQKVIQELHHHYGIDSASGLEAEEEDFLQKMLEEEEEKNTVYFPRQPMDAESCVNDLSKRMNKMEVTEGIAAQSNLNPFAAEFIPGQGIQSANISAPIAVMAQPETHPMTSQIYATNMSASLQGSGMNAMPATMQNIIWRQNNPHINPRYNAHHVQPQMTNPVRGMFGTNGPLYISNMPMSMYPMMNGGAAYMRPRFQHADAPDRCIIDEGYEDN